MRKKIFLIFLIMSCLSPRLWARTLTPLKILPRNQGVVFTKTPELQPKTLILVYRNGTGTPVAQAVLEVEVCNQKLCKASVKKQRKDTTLNLGQVYSLKRLTEAPHSSRLPRRDPSTPGKNHSAHLTYGGPIPSGVGLIYKYHGLTYFTAGISAGVFSSADSHKSSEISSNLTSSQERELGFSGQQFSLAVEKKIFELPYEVALIPAVQLGLIRAVIDFRQFLGPKVTHLGPFLGAGLDLHRSWGGFVITLGSGLSYNFIQDSYFDSSGTSFKAPLAGSQIFWRIGGGWEF